MRELSRWSCAAATVKTENTGLGICIALPDQPLYFTGPDQSLYFTGPDPAPQGVT